MEPENASLEKENHHSKPSFSGSMLIFRGCNMTLENPHFQQEINRLKWCVFFSICDCWVLGKRLKPFSQMALCHGDLLESVKNHRINKFQIRVWNKDWDSDHHPKDLMLPPERCILNWKWCACFKDLGGLFAKKNLKVHGPHPQDFNELLSPKIEWGLEKSIVSLASSMSSFWVSIYTWISGV